MFRRLNYIVLTLFVIWIMPLGAFIDRAKEKVACDGQRAICLCSHRVAQQAAQNAGEAILKGPGAAQKEQNGSGGSSHSFLAVQRNNQLDNPKSLYHQQKSFLYSLLVVRSIEHVPKV